MKFVRFIAFYTGIVLFACCHLGADSEVASNPQDAKLKVFTVTGVIKELDPKESLITVEHEAIPDFMPAMTMPFKVKTVQELKGLKAGNRITFRLSVTENKSWIDQIKEAGAPASNESPIRQHVRLVREVEPLSVGDLLPNYRFTNELGRVIRFGDYKGKALALTFIFTRCPIPEFCPLMSKQFTAVQKHLTTTPGTPQNWHLFSISFDPHYDTPAILRGYARIYGYNPEHWSFVTGAMIDIDAITEQFGLPVIARDGTLSHKLRTIVVDAQGRIQKIFPGNQWKPEELSEELIRAANINDNQETSNTQPDDPKQNRSQ